MSIVMINIFNTTVALLISGIIINNLVCQICYFVVKNVNVLVWVHVIG
jgi:hypothetical protein